MRLPWWSPRTQIPLFRPRSSSTSQSHQRLPKEKREIIEKLEKGEIDILIGTHRLISNDIEFHDLGLLIVDEEQRFGVAQKEKLKKIAGNIDVLSLSATPIPRTLNMAMGGLRDISVLDEAPIDRIPIQTYVLEEDDLIVNEAIRNNVDMLVMPECFVPYEWIPILSRTCAKNEMAIVTGVEHLRVKAKNLDDEKSVFNLTAIILPFVEETYESYWYC